MLADLGKKGFFHQVLIISEAARAFIRLQTKLTKERSFFHRIFFVLIAQNISLRLVQKLFKLVGACLNGK